MKKEKTHTHAQTHTKLRIFFTSNWIVAHYFAPKNGSLILLSAVYIDLNSSISYLKCKETSPKSNSLKQKFAVLYKRSRIFCISSKLISKNCIFSHLFIYSFHSCLPNHNFS